MYVIRQGTRVSVSTPAKLNLFLELLGRRPDGFHELDTLMVPVDLFDSLVLRPREDAEIRLSCRWASGYNKSLGGELPTTEENIVVKAMRVLQKRTGTNKGVDIELVKRIPSQAGMGGGSSDAMAALVAGNLALGTRLDLHQLSELGAQIGSDVPFFAFGKLAKCSGRGEVIEPMTMARRLHFVVVKPDFGLSTPQVFSHATLPESPKQSRELGSALEATFHRPSINLRQIGQLFFNRLQEAARKIQACTSWFDQIGRTMERLSVLGHQMSGSGSSYFALCWNRRHACSVAANVRASRLGAAFVVSSLGLKPTV